MRTVESHARRIRYTQLAIREVDEVHVEVPDEEDCDEIQPDERRSISRASFELLEAYDDDDCSKSLDRPETPPKRHRMHTTGELI